MTHEESSINERVAKLIENLAGGKQKRFAEEVGVTPSAISDLFNKRQNKPGLEMLQKIAVAYPSVSMDWLVNGSGEMFKPKPDTTLRSIPSISEGASSLDSLYDALRPISEAQAWGQRLSMIRRIRNISVKDAANAIGLSTQELEQLEQSCPPFSHLAIELIALYGLPENFAMPGVSGDDERLVLMALAETQSAVLRKFNSYTEENERSLAEWVISDHKKYRLQQVIKYYTQIVKQIEGKMFAFWRTSNELTKLMDDVESRRRTLDFYMEHLSSERKSESQELYSADISRVNDAKKRLDRAQDTYDSCLPYHEQNAAELRALIEQRDKLEEELNKLTSLDQSGSPLV